MASHSVHQAASGLEVVGELQRPGRPYAFSFASCPRTTYRTVGTPALHATQLVTDVRLPSVCQLRDRVPQDRDGAVECASRLDLFHGTNNIIDDADVLVIRQTEVGEGVVEAVEACGRDGHLHLIDPPVELCAETTTVK